MPRSGFTLRFARGTLRQVAWLAEARRVPTYVVIRELLRNVLQQAMAIDPVLGSPPANPSKLPPLAESAPVKPGLKTRKASGNGSSTAARRKSVASGK